MGSSEWVAIGLAGLGVLFSIIGWLLARKDDAQGKELQSQKEDHEKDISALRDAIKLLFAKHDADVNNLAEFKLHVAGKHYEAHTVDEKFDKLEGTFKDGFRDMGSKFDRLADAMIRHIEADTNGNKTGKFSILKGEQ